MNAAVKHVESTVGVERKHQTVKRTRVVRRVRKSEKKGLYSLQGFLALSFVAIFLILFGQLYLDSQLSKLHYDTEMLRFQMSGQENINEQLYSKIAELSMHSRVIEIAEQHGLTYNNNITSIGN